MGLQFIKKRFRKWPERVLYQPKNNVKIESVENNNSVNETNNIENITIVENDVQDVKNKKNNKKNKENMFDKDKIAEIEAAVKKMEPEVKVVKTDRGLIERTDSSKIIITEDNRQVLID